MKSWNKKQTFHNISWGECILTGLLALVVLATVLFPITDLDQITTLGDEIQYWGGAMSLLGQDWSHYIDGQAMISYGYSLILLPICMIFKNATFAYKAAIILNGCFFAMSYLLAVKIAKKILPDGNGYKAILGVFVIFLLPIFGESRTTIGPIPVMMFLFWICITIISGLCENKKKRYLVWLGVCTIALTWLDITMLSVFVGMTVYLHFLVEKKELEEKEWLGWILFVMLGFALGYVLEKTWLSHVFQTVNGGYDGSLALLFDKIMTNITNEGIFGIFRALFGKIYALSINTLGLLLPAFYMFIKTTKNEEKTWSVTSKAAWCAGIVMITSFLLNTLAMMGGTEATCREILMTSTLAVVVGPFLLLAFEQLLVSTRWMEESIGYVVVFLVSAVVTSDIFKNMTSIAVEPSFGLLHFAYKSTETTQGMIYYSGIIVITAFLFLCGMIKTETKWKKINQLLTGMGIFLVCILSLFFIGKNTENVIERHEDNTKFQQVADVLNAVGGKIYIKDGDASLKAHIPVIQMLSNQCDLILVKEEEQEREKDIYITSSPYYEWEEELEGYVPNCQIKGVILWSKQDCGVQEKVDAFLTQKEYRASRIKGGKNSVYGEGITLSPGAYLAKFNVKVKKLKGNGDETLEFSVKSGSTVLQTKTYLAKDLKEGEHLNIELPFGSDDFLGNCQFYVKRHSKVKLEIEKVCYQKAAVPYSFGMNAQEDMQEICDFMDKVNQKAGKDGTSVSYKEGDKVPTEDFVICQSDLSVCYDLLKKYTILDRNDAYALLARSDSQYCKYGKIIKGFAGSKKDEIDLRTLLSPDEDGTYHLEDPFKLESGDYKMVLTLKLLSNEKKEEILGVYRLMNGNKRLAGKKIRTEFFENNTCEISLPLLVYNGCNNLRYSVSTMEGVEIEVLDAKIKMNGKKYDIGSEKNLSFFGKIINKTDKKSRVYYYTDRKSIISEKYSLDYLQSLLPKCTLGMMTYDDAMTEQGDVFLITRGYSEKYFRLISKYTMIAQKDSYILWARSEGSLIMDAMKHGAVMLSQENKISAKLLSELQEKEYDGTVKELPEGTYRLYIKAELEDTVQGDRIEVGIVRDKTKKELKEEKESLKLYGYSDKEMEKMIDPSYYTNVEEYAVDDFSENEKVVIYQMHCADKYQNIASVAYNWRESSTTTKILWIEPVQ